MGSKTRLGIIYGGKSSEHEVSLRTALSIIQAIEREKYDILPIYIRLDGSWEKGEWIRETPSGVQELRLPKKGDVPCLLGLADEVDVVFPVIHGPYGEDGTLQGLLEMIHVPYVGSGVLGSAVSMDKVMMKNVFGQHGLPQGKYLSYLRDHLDMKRAAAEIEETLGYPCFVKPANLGSSVGISKAKDREGLSKAIAFAARFDRKIIIEEFIDGRELEIGVLGNDELLLSVVGEIIPAGEFYDYTSKYKDTGTKLEIPADVPESVVTRMQELAVRAFRAVDGAGLSRIDFFWNEETDQLYLNEINTLPGFTPYSMYPLLFAKTGIPYPELIDRLIQLAFARFHDKQQNEIAAESLD